MQVTLSGSSMNNKARIKTELALSLFNNYDSMRVLRMQSNGNVGERKKHVQDIATKRENSWAKKDNSWSKTKKSCEICSNQHATKDCPILIYGPCERCIEIGIPRQRIRHTTRNHKFDMKPNEGNNKNYQNQPNKFGPPPASLQKYNKGNLNLITEDENEQLKNRREITINEMGYLGLRIEVDSNIVEINLDTGCLFEGVIENSMVERLNLGSYIVKQPTTVCLADGTKTIYETVLIVPVRFKEVAAQLKFIVMENCPAKFILGTPGIEKLGLRLNISTSKNE